MAETLPVAGQHLRPALEQLDGEANQVVEIHGVVQAQAGLVLLEQRPEAFRFLLPVDQPCFEAREQAGHRVQVQVPTEAQVPGAFFHQGFPVGLVVDAEARPVAQGFPVLPQHPDPEGMEGRNGEPGELLARQLPDPVGHLPGGLVGEGHRQNRGLSLSPGEEAGDAVGDHPRLARAGAGQNQQRALQGLHGAQLLGIEQPGKVAAHRYRFRKKYSARTPSRYTRETIAPASATPRAMYSMAFPRRMPSTQAPSAPV